MRKFESKFELNKNLFEHEAIGEIDIQNPEFQKELKRIQVEEKKKGETENDYVCFEELLKLVKKFQPYDPTNPDKYFARDIRIAVQDLLKLETPEEMDKIKFYTASGTPLAKFHGIDAFIEYEENIKKNDMSRADFKFTTNPLKMNLRDNITVCAKDLPDPHLQEKEYLERIKKYAEQVIYKMAANKVQEKKKLL